MTTTIEHATTIFEITDLPPGITSKWCFSCTCGHTYGGGLIGLSTRRNIESDAEQHRRNPTREAAHELIDRMRTGDLTDRETDKLAQALLCASQIVDGTPITYDNGVISGAAEVAVDGLVDALRGES